jgi:group I intron endonuclease
MASNKLMTIAIYTITNTLNNKSYIGISSDLKRRWREHKNPDGKCTNLHNAIKKYGYNLFVFKHIADAFTWKYACEIEKELIIDFNTKAPNGYNLTLGGDGTLGFKHTAEEKQRRSERCPTRNPDIAKLIADKQRGVKRPQTSGINNNWYGKIGLKSHVLKHIIIATNISNGNKLTLIGAKDIESHGFNRAHVYACAKNKRKTHKGYTFIFKGELKLAITPK